MTNPNEPINPIESVHRTEITYGLTKREYFAAMAMQGYITNGPSSISTTKLIAHASIEYADALIEALGKDD